MRLMACGEHPQAADSVGINVFKMRYAGVLISGALAGIGGMAYWVLDTTTDFSGFWAVVFIGISILTLPHSIVMHVMIEDEGDEWRKELVGNINT